MMLKFSILQILKINIENKYWQKFLYEYKHVWYTATNADMLLHVKMLKVHLSSYPCQCQRKHDQSNI